MSSASPDPDRRPGSGDFSRVGAASSRQSRGGREQGISLLRLTRQGPRVADRYWTEEFDELTDHGFVWHYDRHDWTMSRPVACHRCGDEMELRGFQRGDAAYRAYALCVMCGWWIEF